MDAVRLAAKPLPHIHACTLRKSRLPEYIDIDINIREKGFRILQYHKNSSTLDYC
jgi:hypothetical protein